MQWHPHSYYCFLRLIFGFARHCIGVLSDAVSSDLLMHDKALSDRGRSCSGTLTFIPDNLDFVAHP